MDKLKAVFAQSLSLLIDINFYISVGIFLVGCVLSMWPRYSFFEFNEELFGALVNNLRLMMVYLAITETIVLTYCFFTKKYQFTILIGFFLVLMIGSLEFYGEVNNVEIDENLPAFLLYVGISHFLFGIKSTLHNNFLTTPHNFRD